MMRLVICLILACALTAHAISPVIVTTYAKRYSDAARAHPNRRYHPDRMNVAAGWRSLYGKTLVIYSGFLRVRVRVTDVMNARYDTATVLRIDASPRVMKSLNMKHGGPVDSVEIVDAP